MRNSNEWNVVCREIPFMLFPEPKSNTTRDWLGEDGLDVYSPKVQKLKDYDIDVEFIVKASESTVSDDAATTAMAQNVRDFIKFLYGRDTNAVGSLLAIYDAYTMIGRKDVKVKSVSPDAYFRRDGGNDGIITFKVSFTVYDPATEVSFSNSNNTLALTGF